MNGAKKRNINKESTQNNTQKLEQVLSTKTANSDNKISLRILSRCIVIFSLLIVVYFSSYNEKIHTFAKQSEYLPGKGLIVQCSKTYTREINKFEGCVPKECKRFVTDNVINDKEAQQLLSIAKKGLKLGGSDGGASILDLHSGALSKGQHFVDIYKMDDASQVFTENDFVAYRVVKDKIKFAVAHHFGANPDKIYLTHPTFFSQITGKRAVTVHDEYWHPHVDKETYKSFHYTTLLYLGNYNTDFQGGRFIYVDDKFNTSVEPRIGRLSMFTSGSENLHYVEKVTSGVRYAITISFTCDEKYSIEDPTINKILKK